MHRSWADSRLLLVTASCVCCCLLLLACSKRSRMCADLDAPRRQTCSEEPQTLFWHLVHLRGPRLLYVPAECNMHCWPFADTQHLPFPACLGHSPMGILFPRANSGLNARLLNRNEEPWTHFWHLLCEGYPFGYPLNATRTDPERTTGPCPFLPTLNTLLPSDTFPQVQLRFRCQAS